MNLDLFASDPRLIFALVVAGVFALIIFIAGKSSAHRLSARDRARIASAWREVTRNIEQSEVHWRDAVVRADAVLDMALRARKFSGKTMAERMGSAARKYPAIEDAFRAHRLRNELAHNPTHAVTQKETAWALRVFERALRALGM